LFNLILLKFAYFNEIKYIIGDGMKPCVICGKSIKKKDSVMAIDYVCSDSCKQQRKQQQPKKISITSLSYWTNSGMSIEEAKQQVSLLQQDTAILML
jgi:predicted nucleic acid-binding Zn ribbon protein